ncbi:ATP-binding protein [Lutimaribacter sp. EGI FJ00015]|uniref:ATP-binding protein n=1 Tax=Lutimaribacter degradans TaxID=2945989 RepID=A0ACC5ZYK3_9RHOB|nr:ATP-binding protein [Lutimaribacter sp. EGI FJ00013]MCM2562439.1 ATP-binding protein [Lutimaribacter sp. EGI FJ00013]MCO0613596.1 ATP-binding protein [Lutimaribacter sp. EGI FJ00015]MCO0636568.1 ATP-binding protein [Lutimaribacter sp. EGI FJ00014]
MRRPGIALAMALLCLGVAWAAPQPLLAVASLAMALTLLGAMAIAALLAIWHRQRQRHTLAMIDACVAHDAMPTFVTFVDGTIRTRNKAATRLSAQAATLAAALERNMASPGAVLLRVQGRAMSDGRASEDVVSRGGHTRITAHMLDDTLLLWRFEDMTDRTPAARGSIALPLLTVGRSGTVLSMNEAARRLVGDRCKSLDRIFPDLPVRPGHVQKVSAADGTIDCLVAQSEGLAGRREIYLLSPPAGSTESTPPDAFWDMLPVALLRLDARGHVMQANRSALELLGRDGCEGIPLSSLMEGLGRSISDWLSDAVGGRMAQRSEFLRLTREDRDVFVQVSLHRAGSGDSAVLVAVLTDATDFKALEAQFVQSQKMQAIGELAGGVAHDFNNLLTAITGHCDLLLLRHDQGAPDFADLMQINQNANRAAALVGQLLAFSRKQTLRPEVLDMRNTLSDLTHLLNRLVGERISLSLSHDPALHAIRADKRQLEQVLMNLVVNARDAMRDGGEIRIETENLTLEAPANRDRAVIPAGDYVTVKVSDDGCGMGADVRERVFEPFFTTKGVAKGTGLGLSTAYGIVKQSGGFIFVDSEKGRGTVFTLYLPRWHDADMPARPEAAARPAPIATKPAEGVILLVEDEAPVRAFAARALRLRGYTVIEADSAEAALTVLKDPELSVDVFVTDVVMPGRDGPSWVREALQDRPSVQVVFVSGYAEESFGEVQRDMPNSVFLPKPFSLAELTDTVQQRLQ